MWSGILFLDSFVNVPIDHEKRSENGFGVERWRVKKEITECMYVSILMDETSDVSCLSQLSSVVRYVDKDGQFVKGFLDLLTLVKIEVLRLFQI